MDAFSEDETAAEADAMEDSRSEEETTAEADAMEDSRSEEETAAEDAPSEEEARCSDEETVPSLEKDVCSEEVTTEDSSGAEEVTAAEEPWPGITTLPQPESSRQRIGRRILERFGIGQL